LTGVTGPIFFAAHPDAGGQFTVDANGAVLPLGSAALWN
jgi:hypothetical protein